MTTLRLLSFYSSCASTFSVSEHFALSNQKNPQSMSLLLLSAQLLAVPERVFDYLKLSGINMLEVIFPFHYSTLLLIPLSEVLSSVYSGEPPSSRFVLESRTADIQTNKVIHPLLFQQALCAPKAPKNCFLLSLVCPHRTALVFVWSL